MPVLDALKNADALQNEDESVEDDQRLPTLLFVVVEKMFRAVKYSHALRKPWMTLYVVLC